MYNVAMFIIIGIAVVIGVIWTIFAISNSKQGTNQRCDGDKNEDEDLEADMQPNYISGGYKEWVALGRRGSIPRNVWVLCGRVDVFANLNVEKQFKRWITCLEEDEVECKIGKYLHVGLKFPKKELVDELSKNMLSMSMWQLIIEIEAILLYWGEYYIKRGRKNKLYLSLPNVDFNCVYTDEIVELYERSEVEKIIEYLFVCYYKLNGSKVRQDIREGIIRANCSDPHRIADEMQLPNVAELDKKSDELIDTLEEYIKDKWRVIKRFKKFYVWNKIADKGLYYLTLFFTCYMIYDFWVYGFSQNLLILYLCIVLAEVAMIFWFRALKRYAVWTKEQFVNIESGAFNVTIPYESCEFSLDLRGKEDKKVGCYEVYYNVSPYSLGRAYVGYKENRYATQVFRLLNIDPRTEYVYLKVNLLQAELVREAQGKKYVGCIAWTILENSRLISLLSHYGSKMIRAAQQIN